MNRKGYNPDPGRVAADELRASSPAIAAALGEMADYQAVLGSPTAHYHYPLAVEDILSAVHQGLMSTKERAGGADGYHVRLTRWGREIARRLKEGEHAPTG